MLLSAELTADAIAVSLPHGTT
ncbi:MAG: hypothetical protein ACPGIJ_04295, partial [Mycobacterium sp.]